MTVIAWDGTHLAADKRAQNGGYHYAVTKIYRFPEFLVGISGTIGHGLAMVEWLRAGGKPEAFPKAEKDDTAYLMLIYPDGRIVRIEGAPWPIPVEERYHAIGNGRDFALAAMYLGQTAVEAVQLATALCSDCGDGVDVLTLETSA